MLEKCIYYELIWSQHTNCNCFLVCAILDALSINRVSIITSCLFTDIKKDVK